MRVDQRLLERRLAGAGAHDLPAGIDDLVGRRQHEVDALLVHQSGDDAEHRAARYRKPELLAHIVCIGLLADPVAGAELLGKLGAGTRVPAFVDAVENAGELGRVGADSKQAFETAAEFIRGDLPRIGAADCREMRGVDQPGLEEGELVVELDAVDVEGALRYADPPQRVLREEALIGEVVNGQDRRQLGAAPGEVGRHERSLPVIGMDQVCCPILVQRAHRELSGGRGKARKTDVVVGPVASGLVAIGVARPVVELRAQQDIDRQAVPGRGAAERAGRHLRERRTAANDLNMRELFDDIAIAGQHDPDVGERTEGSGECSGNGSESADADKVVHLCRNEQDPQELLPFAGARLLLCKNGSSCPGIPKAARQTRPFGKDFPTQPPPFRVGARTTENFDKFLTDPRTQAGMQLSDKHDGTTTKAFAGLRVLDFSTTIAGPHCARMLADMGAEVIKIETDGGETMRTRPPLRNGCSTVFGQLNVGKKSVVLDLKSEDGKEAVRRLAATADILVENFRPGVMRRLRLDYDSLRAANSALIYCSISGYGQTGPSAELPAYAPVIHAASGYDMAHLAYQPGRSRPDYCGIYHADVVTGTYAFGAIAAALYQRQLTQRGQHIDVSMLESMLSLTLNELQWSQFKVKSLKRPMFGPIETADGYGMVAIASEKTFQNLMKVIGHAEYVSDPRFALYADRRDNWAALMDRVESWSRAVTTEDCLFALNAEGVPSSAYRTVADAMADPQISHRDALSEVADAGGSFKVLKLPFRMSEADVSPGKKMSTLGEHTLALLKETGLSADQFSGNKLLAKQR